MKADRILTAALAAAALALAQQPELDCGERQGDSRRASHCEMREQTMAAPAGILTVDARPNGGISVRGWDRPDVLVRSRVRAAAASDAEARELVRQIRVETAGGRVHAGGPEMSRDRSWSVSYEVFVPRSAGVSAQAQNGGVAVTDVQGRLEFRALNGGVVLKRVGGSVRGHTTNGGLSIELAGSRWEGEGMDVSTTNGGVRLSLPRDYSANLEVGTTNGGLDVDFPVTVQGRLDRRLSTVLGAGGATLRAFTTNGGVRVKRAD